MYVWRLSAVLSAEGGVENVLSKAQRAGLSALWIKVADGQTPFANTLGQMGQAFLQLVEEAKTRGIEVWGWQVPHCPDEGAALAEAAQFATMAQRFNLDGLIMDAEGGAEFFAGGLQEAAAYADAMRSVADKIGVPLAISSNDIPQNIANWFPKFSRIAQVCDVNFPQTYYGGSPSVQNRVDRAVQANSMLNATFIPVGSGYLGTGDGGCQSGSACAECAVSFINLCNARGYEGYGFWHWGGAPLSLWDVLNNTPP